MQGGHGIQKDSMSMLANLDLAAEIQRRDWVSHVALAATQHCKSAGGITRVPLSHRRAGYCNKDL